MYDGKKARKRREWRGFKDTWYAYTHWLKIWKVLIKFAAKPRNIKGFFRYRWMLNFLAVPDFFDRHTEGMRDVQLRMAHTGLGLIVTDMCEMVETIFKADPRIGNDKALSDRIVIFDENMMSEIMNGFPNLRWLSVEGAHNVRPYTRFTDTIGRHGGICRTTNSETTSKFRGQVVAREAERQRTPTARLKTGERSPVPSCFARATAAASEAPWLDDAPVYRRCAASWGF